MKTYFTALIVLLFATAAHAQKIDLRTITCKEAIALPEDTLDVVSVWIDGFMSDDDDPESMVVDFSETDSDEIKAVCQKIPSAKLLHAVEDLEDQASDDE